ncbi:hypothetical protein SAMN04487785_101423 [Dyella jiangningensis]|uniref:hypothetical protein n=1 Tax=Dyella sp. AtDHG13 TaxID=1938897 RepID=UPI00088F6D11|nr:hypothetical protein [Dyella sp. AtDHG13]PXV59617.1 hypothetical protein BDW41_103148 [Dyella sp. AtDHG13]SDJ29801.1 hypothetical protein SAMN04487785_101423 [Dyella jiangningensis]
MNEQHRPAKHESGDRNQNEVADKDAEQQRERDRKINEGEERTARDADRDMGKR